MLGVHQGQACDHSRSGGCIRVLRRKASACAVWTTTTTPATETSPVMTTTGTTTTTANFPRCSHSDEAAHNEQQEERQDKDAEQRVDLVPPHAGENVVQLDVDRAERQEARHHHLGGVPAIPRNVLGNLFHERHRQTGRNNHADYFSLDDNNVPSSKMQPLRLVPPTLQRAAVVPEKRAVGVRVAE